MQRYFIRFILKICTHSASGIECGIFRLEIVAPLQTIISSSDQKSSSSARTGFTNFSLHRSIHWRCYELQPSRPHPRTCCNLNSKMVVFLGRAKALANILCMFVGSFGRSTTTFGRFQHRGRVIWIAARILDHERYSLNAT